MDYVKLAQYIKEEIIKDFELIHLSGNLMNTLKIEINEKTGEVSLKIPAQKYDIPLFREKGVILYTGNGSYASEVNKYNANHKNYAERSIKKAIERYLQEEKINAEVDYNGVNR